MNIFCDVVGSVTWIKRWHCIFSKSMVWLNI